MVPIAITSYLTPIISIITLLIGCTSNNSKATVSASNKTFQESTEKTAEERDSALTDWPFPGANGNWIPSRDGIENSDTIVDGYPYNHV